MTSEQLDELEAHAEGRILTGDEAREELVRVIQLLRKAQAEIARLNHIFCDGCGYTDYNCQCPK